MDKRGSKHARSYSVSEAKEISAGGRGGWRQNRPWDLVVGVRGHFREKLRWKLKQGHRE